MYCPNCGQQQFSRDEVLFALWPGTERPGRVARRRKSACPSYRGKAGLSRFSAAQRNSPRTEVDVFQWRAVSYFPFYQPGGRRRGTHRHSDNPLFCVARVAALRTNFQRQKCTRYSSGRADIGSWIGVSTRHIASSNMNIPVSDARRQQVRTNELAQPPSVTENTTRLLDDD